MAQKTCRDLPRSGMTYIREEKVTIKQADGDTHSKGLAILDCFTGSAAESPITWRCRCVTIATGNHNEDCQLEAPSDWPQIALETAVKRYFQTMPFQSGVSIRQLVEPVVQAITDRGLKNGIFASPADAETYQAELAFACYSRYGWLGESIWQRIGRSPALLNRTARSTTPVSPKRVIPLPYAIHLSGEQVRDRKALRKTAGSIPKGECAIVCFDDTIADWHSCPASGPVASGTEPSGYLFLPESIYKTATINVNRFLDSKGRFNLEALCHTVTLFTIALDILVDVVPYANRSQASISKAHRPIGISYAGLAPLLMRLGLPYDSDPGRAVAAALTSLITATAVETSQRLAAATRPFSKYRANRTSLLAILRRHAAAADSIPRVAPAEGLHKTAKETWDRILASSTGFRNAYFTHLVAAGTAGLILDADVSDIGPMTALVKYARLEDGYVERQVNPCVDQALATLRYKIAGRRAMLAHVLDTATMEGAPGLRPEHLPVFDCQFAAAPHGQRTISAAAQVEMMAAVQPMLSGGIQRTLILPASINSETIADLIHKAWERGLRTISLYRSTTDITDRGD